MLISEMIENILQKSFQEKQMLYENALTVFIVSKLSYLRNVFMSVHIDKSIDVFTEIVFYKL